MTALFVAALLGSLHCVGMCGGFVLALGRPSRRPWARLLAPAAFLGGKAATYVLLGALAGLAGGAVVRSGWFGAARSVLAVVAGALMVLAGLQIAGLLREWPAGRFFGPSSPWARAFRAVAQTPGAAAPFAAGALAGLLPCPLVYAFLAAALATGGVLPAMGTMGILGLGTAPALLLVAFLGAAVSPLVRRRIVRVAGLVVVVAGAVTFLRGLAPDLLHRVLPHVAPPL